MRNELVVYEVERISVDSSRVGQRPKIDVEAYQRVVHLNDEICDPVYSVLIPLHDNSKETRDEIQGVCSDCPASGDYLKLVSFRPDSWIESCGLVPALLCHPRYGKERKCSTELFRYSDLSQTQRKLMDRRNSLLLRR